MGLTRGDVVVAVGGGMVTDVAGFAAATWHRGVPVVHVATTLLGMVDAAIGGKTGVNLPDGKNLIGAFWQPAGVICDLDALATLPARERRSGDGEMAKYHFLTGDDLAAMDLPDRVARCVEIKAEVVAADEREAVGAGRRALLNYGHTLAHALEIATGHDLTHGEAVGVGLVFAAELAAGLGRIDRARVDEHRARRRRDLRPADQPAQGGRSRRARRVDGAGQEGGGRADVRPRRRRRSRGRGGGAGGRRARGPGRDRRPMTVPETDGPTVGGMTAELPPIGYAERPAAVRGRLDGNVLIVSTPSNVRWLTGFGGTLGWVVIGPDRFALVTDGRYAERAAADMAAAGVDAEVVVGRTRPEIRDLVVAAAGPGHRVLAEAAHLSHAAWTDFAKDLDAGARRRHDHGAAASQGRRRAGPDRPSRRDRRHRAHPRRADAR